MKCAGPECDSEKLVALGYCRGHYTQVNRCQPLTPIYRDWSVRFWKKVDKTETCWNWTGATVPAGYGKFMRDGRLQYVHRISYELAGNVIPTGYEVDHLCRNRACLNPDHLEAVTVRTNRDRRTHTVQGKSKYRGVQWKERPQRWVAIVKKNGTSYWLGSFTDELQAALTAEEGRKKHGVR